MSNVLIGIIGVILFIGLALAGALILGEDFMSASSSSKATAAISNGRQIAQAVAMHDLKTGRSLGYFQPDGSRTTPANLVPRYLKTAATPNNWHFHAAGSGRIYAAADLPFTDENRQVCLEVQRQTGQISQDATDISTDRLPAGLILERNMGCIIQTVVGVDHYMIFVTL